MINVNLHKLMNSSWVVNVIYCTAVSEGFCGVRQYNQVVAQSNMQLDSMFAMRHHSSIRFDIRVQYIICLPPTPLTATIAEASQQQKP